jgi:two-component system chemotaxis response regulator CheY
MAKILIVDDSIVARMSLKSCIPKDQGHELFEASDGVKAIEIFISARPDVTFLDLTMPDKSGMEVLEELKRDFPEAVIIILSADIQKQTQERVRQLGAFSIVKKPPVKDAILAELAKAFVIAGVS